MRAFCAILILAASVSNDAPGPAPDYEGVRPANEYPGPLENHTISGTKGTQFVLDDLSVWISGLPVHEKLLNGSVQLVPVVEGDNTVCELVEVGASDDEDSAPFYAVFIGWIDTDGHTADSSESAADGTSKSQPPTALKSRPEVSSTEAEILASITYSGPLGGHRIDKVIDDYIILDDGSVWESSSISVSGVTWWSGRVRLVPISKHGPFVFYRLEEARIVDDGIVRAPVHVSFEGWLVVDSKLSGEFNGWDGETVLVLDNGQIWKQSAYTYLYMYKFRPETIIIKGWAGLHYAIVEGGGEPVRVFRLN